MPLVVLAFHISMMVIYDLDQPVPDRPQYLGILHALVWDVAILGLLQPVAALLVALVICPLTSFTIATGGYPKSLSQTDHITWRYSMP